MMYELLLTNPMVQALGRSLLHFFWQGTLLAMVLWTVNVLAGKSPNRQSSARIRYSAASIVMLLMALALVITLIESYPSQSASHSVLKTTAGPHSVLVGASLPAIASPAGDGIGLSGWVVCLWFVGVLILTGRAAGGWIRAQTMKRRGCQLVSPESIEAFSKLMLRLRVARSVRLCTSAVAKTPAVIGWIRPVIFLPVAAMTGLSETQLRFILAHELAHIRRHDYLVNLLQTAVETILFYHPAVWWVGRQMRIERENCCDDLAIDVCGDAAGYAQALAQLEELRIGAPEPALAASGGELLGRIRRLLEQEQTKDRVPKSAGAVLVGIVLICFVATPVMRSSSASPQLQTTVQTNQPATTAPAAVQSPASQPNPSLDAVRARGAGNGVGSGPGNLLDPGVQAEIRRIAEEYRRIVGDYQRNIFGVPTIPQQGSVERGPSAQSTELLIKLYDGSQDTEVKRHILDYLGVSNNPQASEKVLSVARSDTEPELRRHAVDYLASRADSVDMLVSLYDNNREPEIKRLVLDYLGASSSPQAFEKLLSVARSDPEPQLRRHAIDYIGGKPNSFDTLVSLYDGSREPEMKRLVLDYLGASKDDRATEKLFSIAQSDPDRELRRAAVDYLATR